MSADPTVSAIDDRIFQIDPLMFGRPRFASLFLVKGRRAAILDAGVSVTADTVLKAVAAAGVRLEDVDWICLTHAHYDHAGGAHALLQRLKALGADVKVACAQQPAIYLGRQDILDKIMASGRANEGARAGVMHPIETGDLRVLTPGAVLDLGGCAIQAIEAPGHANGHLVFLVPQSDFVFAGDACGVCGRTAEPSPTIAPTSFAPEYRHAAYVDTVRAIAGRGLKNLGMAHFGVLADPREALLMSLEMAEWVHGLVGEMLAGRRTHAQVVALMSKRLNGTLLPLYQSQERTLVTLKAMIAGMAHDLERPTPSSPDGHAAARR